MVETLKRWAHALKKQLVIAWHIAKHPQTPWWLKAWWGITLAYALSPIDLIPDFIPVIGFLDELILLPAMLWAGFAVAQKIAPLLVDEARKKADQHARLPSSKIGAAIIITLWLIAITAFLQWCF
jgi:uncharacterized membrane protein YkvA (DUF1232 family)